MDKVLQMLLLQQELNDSTNGENWEEGITKNKKPIDWKRCIYMECAEMVDSFAWKHWKNISKEPDWENLQIEVVDVWHFVMSEALRNYSINFRGSIEELALNISEMPGYRKLYKEDPAFAASDEVIDKVEELMFDVLKRNGFVLEGVLEKFFELVLLSGLNISSLYRLYVGKNILNKFRQDHGYKDGSYIKVWNGEEDNIVMKRIWDENGELKPEVLYRELGKVYEEFALS